MPPADLLQFFCWLSQGAAPLCTTFYRYLTAVFTIRNWLILGTLIAFTVATAAQIVSVPSVAIELNTDLTVHTAAAYSESAPVERVAAKAPTSAPAGTEATVRSYFSDIPVMIAIARCESGFQHTNPATGGVRRGIVNSSDLGVMQINEYYHADTAAKLNLNIYTLQGNLAYARYLYNTQGTRPWNASRACWQRSPLAYSE